MRSLLCWCICWWVVGSLAAEVRSQKSEVGRRNAIQLRFVSGLQQVTVSPQQNPAD
jgi:hypothetical protein